MSRKPRRPCWHTYLGKLLAELRGSTTPDDRRDNLTYVTGYISALMLARVIDSPQEERLTKIKRKAHRCAVERSKTP